MLPDLTAIRTEYARAGLDESDLEPSPTRQIEKWLRAAIDAGHPEPTAMTLATVGADGTPSARVVLLKGVDARGLVFFTNYDSAKGRQLESNPRACVNLFWVLLERQVRVTGVVEKVSREESEAYFRGRPRESQLGAWASEQSSVLAGREALEARLAEVRARFGEGEVPCPPHWGGYRLRPETVEFWQGRPSRLHDRLRYARTGEQTWTIERLSP
ncbi:MAG TPA: pyridoxamine 5'-phosphate oxidase [Labilithrix sp.]|jgi:pyridoxamine 5'-phosphate oxidase|nr:pyridoxamine 5'-phosphate oxidase [Labilithrix sp.]